MHMNRLLAGLLSMALIGSTACSEAQNEQAEGKGKKGKGGKKKDKTEAMNPVAGLTKVGTMPSEVPESSGLSRGPEAGTFYTHGDTRSPGGGPSIYLVRENGQLVRRIELQGVQQQDWESVSQDTQGRLYIADCGNNGNDRQDLTIYRIDPKNLGTVSKIQFSYPDQKEFPPAKEERNFDVEASLWHNGRIYLFSRDRANDRTSKIYSLDANGPARQTAQRVGELTLPGQVTDAALSPDGSRLVLLGREQIFVGAVSGSNFGEAKMQAVEMKGAGQTEGVVFIDNNTVLISSEQGALYRYNLPQ
ncbi:hypothetical protein ASU33_17455 [Solirubrum puertoriconensis]|uniref:SMP-30/Gluconolactonase/LRE-like region domain-containing protein n=2 Tax=Solirubrum puertoriconensis TaxID=1751427 RepID=A0A9X0L661_SOLP1|nr:hypothetical protein ASU33_17455 [Solirubrum puertoriconensis]